jgi:hypothetical protein
VHLSQLEITSKQILGKLPFFRCEIVQEGKVYSIARQSSSIGEPIIEELFECLGAHPLASVYGHVIHVAN